MLKVKVLHANGAEELFYAQRCELQGELLIFDQENFGFRTLNMNDSQHIEVKHTDPAERKLEGCIMHDSDAECRAESIECML